MGMFDTIYLDKAYTCLKCQKKILYAGVVGSLVVREGRDVDVVAISEYDERPMLFHEGRISVLLR